MRIKNILLASVGMAAAFGTVAPAFAQPAAPAAQPAEDDGRITDIVVTAQRRSERMQDVPIAVSAIDGNTLTARGISNTQDLSLVTPGLSFGNFSGSAIIYLRGVGNGNPVVGNDPSVAVYIDGVYQPAPKALQFGLANVERIEVLKGPQGTLFGRNATGGAIQVITRTPSDRFTANLDASYESYNTFEGKAYVGGPISEKLTADIAVYYRDQTDGIGTNFNTGRDVNKGWEYSARTKLVFRPDDATDITVAASRARIRSSLGVSYQLQPGAAALDALGTGTPARRVGDAYDTNSTGDPILTVKQTGLSLRIDHDFGGARLASITGYNKTNSFYYYDIDQSPANVVNADLPEYLRSVSQEIQLLSPSDSKLQWIVGGFFYDAKYGQPLTLTGLGLGPAVFDHRETQGKSRSYSVFAQGTYPLGEQTNLTLGGRYSWDKLRYRGQDFTAFGATPVFTDRASSKQPTWRVSVDHKLAPDVMVYASMNRGYKSGSFSTINVPSEPATKPEKLDAYEIGLKSLFADRRVRLNIAGFYYNYSNLQVLVNQGVIATNKNAAKARIYGMDAELEIRPVENLNLNAGISLLNAKFKDFPNAAFYAPNPASIGGNSPVIPEPNAKGNRIPRTPKYTINAGITYTIPTESGDFGLSVTNFYSNGFYWHVDNRIKQRPYNITNAEVSFALPGDHWRFRLFAHNLFNKLYYNDIQESNFADFGVAAPPRYIGGGIQLKY